LTNSTIVDVDEAKNKALDDALLSIVSSDDYAEICRERACTCLNYFLSRLMFGEYDKEDNSVVRFTRRDDQVLSLRLLEYAQSFLKKFIPICVNRMSSTMPSRTTNSNNTGGCMMPVERSEEIRLLMVQIIRLVVQFLGTSSEMTSSNVLNNSEELEPAVSSLCLELLPKSSLLDPYPELKQESCNLIMALCRVFPQCIEKHVETLLTPLVGTSLSKLNGEQLVESDSMDASTSTTIEKPFACLQIMATSTNTLLRHRHSKIRRIGLETVTAIIASCKGRYEHRGGDTFSDLDGVMDRVLYQVLPNVEPLGPFDKSQSVRIQMSQMVCFHLRLFLEELIDNQVEALLEVKRTVVTRLLVLHLMSVSDECETVKETAEQHGRELVSRYNQQLGDYNIAKLIRRFAKYVLQILLYHIEHCRTAEHKKRYLGAFSSMLHYIFSISSAEEDECELLPSCFHSEMKSILSILCDAFSSPEEKNVYIAATRATASLGCNSQTRKSALDIILASIGNEIEGDISSNVPVDCRNEARLILLSSPRHFSTMLCVTSGLIRGMLSLGNNCPHIDDLTGMMKISSSVTGEKIIKSVYDSEEAAFSLLDVMKGVTLWCKKYMASYKEEQSGIDIIFQNNLFCCMHLLGCNHSLQLSTSTQNLIAFVDTNNLAGDIGSPVSTNLTQRYLEKYFLSVLNMILHDFQNKDELDTWTYGNSGIFAFDAFLRVSTANCISIHFHLIAPVFEAHLRDGSQCQEETNEDYLRKKLFFMALLESLFSGANETNGQMREFTERLICNAILPNLVWQSGGLASSLRKVSIAVLYSILCGVGVTRVVLCKFAPSLLPILRSTLEDDDDTTRELATAVLGKILALLPNSLGEEAVQQLYPDLMRGLDDSNQRVRFVSCDAIISFLSSSPLTSFRGEIIESVVEDLFLHLDDPDPLLQEKILEVIGAASKIDLHAVDRIARKSSSATSTRRISFLE
jgi:hypothetical protein